MRQTIQTMADAFETRLKVRGPIARDVQSSSLEGGSTIMDAFTSPELYPVLRHMNQALVYWAQKKIQEIGNT